MYILNHPVSHSLIFQLPNNVASRDRTQPQWVASVYTKLPIMLDSYVHSLCYRVVHEGRTLVRAWCHRNETNLTLCSTAGGNSIFKTRSLRPKDK